MTIRIDVISGGKIEVMRPKGNRSQFLYYNDPDEALIVIKYLLKRDIEKEKKERFVPSISKEARKAFQQLSKGSPYDKQNKTT